MKINQTDTESLSAFERNPKIHPEKQLLMLQKSISKFGFTNPILAIEDGTIVAGHARWEAAKRLNMKQVPVITLKMGYEESIAYVVADNRLAEIAETHGENLSSILCELQALPDFDIESVGFDAAELGNIEPVDVIEFGETQDNSTLDHVYGSDKFGMQLGNFMGFVIRDDAINAFDEVLALHTEEKMWSENNSTIAENIIKVLMEHKDEILP